MGLVFAIGGLWTGDEWLRRLVGAAFVFLGAANFYLSGRIYNAVAQTMPPEGDDVFTRIVGYSMGVVAAFGLFYLSVGLLILLSPSLRAFFRYQREGLQMLFDEA